MLQGTDERTTTTTMMERRHNGFVYATEGLVFFDNFLEDSVAFFYGLEWKNKQIKFFKR